MTFGPVPGPVGAPKAAAPGRGVDWQRIKAVILPFLWPRESAQLRLRVVVAFALLVLAKIVTVQVPFFFKTVVDRLSGPEDALLVLPLAALLAYGLARLAAAGFGELRDAIFAKVAERAARRVSLKVFAHLFQLSLRYHLERRTGELARITERGVQAIRFLLGVILFNVGPTLLEFALVIGILLHQYPWYFALITFLTIVAYAGFTFVASEWRIAIRREMNARDNEVSGQTVDSLLNYETVKAFTNESLERARLDRTLALYERAAIRSETSLAALNFGQAAIIAIGVTVIMVLAARGVVARTLTVGDIVLLNGFLLQLYQPLNFLGVVYRQVRQSLTDLESLMGLLDLQPEVLDRADARPLALAGAEVRFEGVTFGYDARRPILRDLSFAIPAGQTLAVVGSSGAGKSTLVRLLFRFYDVDQGRILIDGQDVRALTQDSLRGAIGLVPQDTVLFNDTIGANIAYGRPGASEDAIEAAARAAQIHDFIMSLPDRYETLVGERGLKLSGGEKQRVAIARMVLKDPPILVFDEATSALDSHTERLIQTALRRVSTGRTTLIIAHRLSTVVDADQILVLERGAVIEHGRHHQLLARRGAYAQMWARQQEAPAA
jgi:ATP-binding cassette, subfamily B, heavy metal transporter